MNKNINESGFTLIEIIAVLLITAILAVALGNAIVYGVQNLIFSRSANQLSQQAQVALARVQKELVEATNISTATATQVDYTTSDGQYILLRDGNRITLQKTSVMGGFPPQTLIDNIAASNVFTYLKTDGSNWVPADGLNQLSQIRVVIISNGIGGSGQLTFQTTINPRKSNMLNAPKLF